MRVWAQRFIDKNVIQIFIIEKNTLLKHWYYLLIFLQINWNGSNDILILLNEIKIAKTNKVFKVNVRTYTGIPQRVPKNSEA